MRIGKKAKSRLLLLVIVLVTLELTPFLLSPLLYGRSFSRAQIRAELKQQFETNSPEQGQDGYLGDHILHPYLGFVSIPKDAYNRFCLPGADPLAPKSPDTVHVCITGGSVAMGLYQKSGKTFIAELQQSPKYRDKEIRLTAFTLGGFKQPQQLMAVNYFLALGASFDLVINLDGFNEIVLPYSDNLPMGVFPSYPRHWNFYSRKGLDSRAQLLIAEQVGLGKKRHNLGRFFRKTGLRHSNFGLLMWSTIDRKHRLATLEVEDRLRRTLSEESASYQSTGPAETVTDTTAFFQAQAEVWARSSQQLAGLEHSGGFKYFHFLQPNQYVSDSKPLTAEEMEIAIEEGPFAYKDAVKMGYPHLLEAGAALVAAGVRHHDLTSMFRDETRTVYSDKCCHFNQLGYDLIAERIAATIRNSPVDEP